MTHVPRGYIARLELQTDGGAPLLTWKADPD